MCVELNRRPVLETNTPGGPSCHMRHELPWVLLSFLVRDTQPRKAGQRGRPPQHSAHLEGNDRRQKLRSRLRALAWLHRDSRESEPVQRPAGALLLLLRQRGPLQGRKESLPAQALPERQTTDLPTTSFRIYNYK